MNNSIMIFFFFEGNVLHCCLKWYQCQYINLCSIKTVQGKVLDIAGWSGPLTETGAIYISVSPTYIQHTFIYSNRTRFHVLFGNQKFVPILSGYGCFLKEFHTCKAHDEAEEKEVTVQKLNRKKNNKEQMKNT